MQADLLPIVLVGDKPYLVVEVNIVMDERGMAGGEHVVKSIVDYFIWQIFIFLILIYIPSIL